MYLKFKQFHHIIDLTTFLIAANVILVQMLFWGLSKDLCLSTNSEIYVFQPRSSNALLRRIYSSQLKLNVNSLVSEKPP